MKPVNNQIVISGNPRGWPTASILQNLLETMQKMKVLPRKILVLNVSIVGNVEMIRLNFKFRKKKKTTDVLSFEQPHVAGLPESFLFLGDLVLCESVLRRQARDQGHGIKHELEVLLCHGLLHLLGYDHERSQQEHRRMAMLEQKILGAGQVAKKENSGLIARARVEKF